MSRFFLSIPAFLWFAFLGALYGAVLAVMFALFTAPAQADGLQCFPRDELVQQLAGTYGEHPVQRGLSGDTLVEVFAAESGSWSLVLTAPSGTACILIFGEAMERLSPLPEGDPA